MNMNKTDSHSYNDLFNPFSLSPDDTKTQDNNLRLSNSYTSLFLFVSAQEDQKENTETPTVPLEQKVSSRFALTGSTEQTESFLQQSGFLQQENESLKERIKSFLQQTGLLQQENESLRGRIELSSQQMGLLQKENEILRMRLGSFVQLTDLHQRENDSVRKALNASDHKITQICTWGENINEENIRLTEENLRLSEELKQSDQKLITMRDKKRKQPDNSKEENLQEQIEILRKSQTEQTTTIKNLSETILQLASPETSSRANAKKTKQK